MLDWTVASVWRWSFMFVKSLTFGVFFQSVSWAMVQPKLKTRVPKTYVGLGIDAGGSSSRWSLRSSRGEVLAEGTSGPLTGHVFDAHGGAEQLARFRTLLEAAKAVRAPDALVAGITGLHPGTPAARLLGRIVADTLGLEPPRALLDNDMHVAYAGAFAPGAGVLIYAGTGSVAYHESAAGETVRAGGYGYLIDDAGGGYWIGHRALQKLFRDLDAGESADTPLAEALYARFGSRHWPEIMPVVYGGGRSFVASLAPAVAAAERAGDAGARAILAAAGRELARLVEDVQRRLERPLPVAFAGGITRLSPILTAALEAQLGRAVRRVEDEPVGAAAELALRLAARADT